VSDTSGFELSVDEGGSSSSATASTSTKRKTSTFVFGICYYSYCVVAHIDCCRTSSTSSKAASPVAKRAKAGSHSSSLDGNLQQLLVVDATFQGSVKYSDGDSYAFELCIESTTKLGEAVGVVKWKSIGGAETEVFLFE
jgi:hypothetical protein